MKRVLVVLAALVMFNTSNIIAQGGKMKGLDLSQEQKTKLMEIRKQNKAKIDAINAKSITEEEKKKEIEALKQLQKEEVGKILTPEQVAKMKDTKNDKIKGEKKEFEEEDDDEKQKKGKVKEFAKKQSEEVKAIRADSTMSNKEKAKAIKEIKKENAAFKKENLTPEQIAKIAAKKENGKKNKGNKKED